MKNKMMLILMAVVLIASVNVYAAKVNNVELSYQDGFTVARIDVEGTVRFSHQTEIAKDGKPYRVIVDILSATHELVRKTFTSDLPKCPVIGIRSSQYSVEPEKIVRIVFDMDSERIYRIDSDDKAVTIIFSDKGTEPFPSWQTNSYASKEKVEKPVVMANNKNHQPEKTASELNKSINDDRILSLKGANQTVTDANLDADNTESVINDNAKAYGPKVDYAALQKEVQQQKEDAEAKAKAEADAKAKQLAEAKAKAEADAKAKQLAEAKAEADAKAKQLAEAKTEAETPKANNKSVAKADKPASQKAEQPQPQVAEKDNQDNKTTPTSRFRRNPASSQKIKGTMVAEFPKRLVIKYKASKYRDPFETLINENKSNDNPLEKRIPNVEGLKLVGIIQSDGEGNRALFEDNDGYGYILKSGDKVRKGYVLRVDKSKVYFQIFEYGWSRTVSLNLES